MVLRGRLTPEVGALLLRALDAARETLYQRARAGAGPPAHGPADGAADPAAAAGGRAGAAGGDGAASRLDPGTPGERYQVVVHVDAAVLADPDAAGPIRAGRRDTRFRGNVPAAGVRREPGGDAARRATGAWWRSGPGRGRFRRRCGGRCTIGTGAAASPAASAGRPGPSRAPLGAGRPDHAVESRAALSAASPRGSRGGLPGRARSDDGLQFRRPDGRLLPEVPAPGAVPANPVATIRAGHAAQGLSIARNRAPARLGERLDLGWAIDVLHPPATGAPLGSVHKLVRWP